MKLKKLLKALHKKEELIIYKYDDIVYEGKVEDLSKEELLDCKIGDVYCHVENAIGIDLK